jgi:hypothetical protein
VGREGIAGIGGVVTGKNRIEHIGLALREVGPTELGPPPLGAQGVDAGRHGDSRYPMGERHLTLILVQSGEHFQKNILGQIIFTAPPGQAGADDADDLRVKVVDEESRGLLIASANSRQPALDVGRRFGVRGRGHGAIEGSACTKLKTCGRRRGYDRSGHAADRHAAGRLDSPPAQSFNLRLMHRIAQALRLI